MANFSITSNHYLRVIYSNNQDLATSAGRSNEKSTGRLTSADSSALRKGIKSLADFKYDMVNEDGPGVKDEYFGKLKAFSDAYNNTLQTSSRSGNKSISKLADKIKSLSSSSAKQLEKYGISFDDSGYMSVKQSAVDNISLKSFEKVVGRDSEFSKELDKLAKQMSKHIDIAV